MLETEGLSQTVSVETKLISERRLFINMFLASSVKTRFDRKCSVGLFTQRQMKEINLLRSDTGVCWITSYDLFAPSGKNLKVLLCDRK